MSDKIMAYRRDNGRVGVRNHVLILPVDDISNAACEAVANNVKGTMASPHAYGRLQFGEDLDIHFRTIIGTGANANVAAVVVIAIEPDWTQKIVDGIAATGKPVFGVSIEQKGDFETMDDLAKAVRGHWSVESDNYVRDVTFKEDKIKNTKGQTSRQWASFRTAALNIIRRFAPHNIPAKVESWVDNPKLFRSDLKKIGFFL